jgi:integral membrane protein
LSITTLTARTFRVVAVFEAFTWAGLLVGMYFKYLGNGSELGVQIFGPLHGGAFIVYVLVALAAAYQLRWGGWPTLVALAASIPPLGTLPADWWLHRTGRLTAPEEHTDKSIGEPEKVS